MAARVPAVCDADQVGEDRLDLDLDRRATLGIHRLAIRLHREGAGTLELGFDLVERGVGRAE